MFSSSTKSAWVLYPSSCARSARSAAMRERVALLSVASPWSPRVT